MTNMTKEQLEQLLSCTLTDFECGRINECISYFSGDYGLFQTKDDIVKFYRAFGIDGINRLNCHHSGREEIINYYRIVARKEQDKYLDLFVKYTLICNHDNAPVEETHEDKSGTCQPVDMAVLKEHFEFVTNCTMTDNEYSRIEKCIDAFSDLLATDNDIALFYHTFGINGIDHLLCALAGFKAVEDHLREKAYEEHRKYSNLQYKYNQLSSYITAFLKALVKFFNDILNDPVFKFDYSVSVFHALIDYLSKEIERFESEVK